MTCFISISQLLPNTLQHALDNSLQCGSDSLLGFLKERLILVFLAYWHRIAYVFACHLSLRPERAAVCRGTIAIVSLRHTQICPWRNLSYQICSYLEIIRRKKFIFVICLRLSFCLILYLLRCPYLYDTCNLQVETNVPKMFYHIVKHSKKTGKKHVWRLNSEF